MKEKALLVVAAVFFFVGFGFLIYKTGGSSSQVGTVISYNIGDKERPRLKILGESSKDIGTLKVSEEKTAIFKIKNEGEKPLQIFRGSTNCGCTFGQVKTKNQESPLFGMHSNQNFIIELASQEEAVVEVTYRPYLMPVYGKVIRAVRLKTNDPGNPEVEFVIEAEVK